jgi:RNA polymerase sigma-70 factor (ECF subfamily)
VAHDSTDLDPRQLARPAPPRLTFQQLYTQHGAFCWRALRHLGVPPAAVDDAVQELWVVVHRRHEEFEGRSDIKSWLFGIAINVARNQRRAQRRLETARASQRELLEPHSDPSERERQRNAFDLVQSYLATLDEQRREIFVSCLLEGMSAAETASATGLALDTVQNRVRALRRSFKSWLTQHGSPQ